MRQVGSELFRIDWLERRLLLLTEGTRKPVSPWTTTSLIPPTALATTGTSQDIASRLMMPNGS